MFIAIWIILSILIGYAGTKRTIGGFYAFLGSIIFSPLIGFIAVLCYPKRENSRYILISDTGRERGVDFSQIRKNVPYIYKTLGGSFEVYIKRSRKEAGSEKIGDYSNYAQAKNKIITAYRLDAS